MKLTQKHLLKGRQEFEIFDDYVKFCSKAPFKDKVEMTVMLTVLNPEPVITRTSLDFTSRVNGEALLSLYLGKPNAREFNAFVSALKNRAQEEYQVFAGLKPIEQSTGLGANVYDEPPEFEDSGLEQQAKVRKDLSSAGIEEAIEMLNTYLNGDETAPLIAALEQLKSDPGSQALQGKVVNAFNELGPTQGAVLTYAPYVGILMSDGSSGAP